MKIGVSSCGDFTDESFFADLEKNNIFETQVVYTYDKEFETLDLKKIENMAKRHNINLCSIHLPYAEPWDINVATTDKNLRKHTIEFFSDCIKKASEYNYRQFVIHPANHWEFVESQRKDWIESSKECMDKLGDVANGCGGVLCVENINTIGYNSDEILDIVSVNKNLRICFDLNHSLHQDNVDFIHKIKDKLETIHVSDYDFIEERHWLPGEGKSDFNALYKALLDVNYKGVWMYEVPLKPIPTIHRDRDLTAADFYQNATDIFNGKKPKAIGKPLV